MAFGQQAGPPATHRQVQELLELLQAAGYDGFRAARGPLGFTQRQGGGKFTRDEADAFIAQLQEAAEATEADATPTSPRADASPHQSAAEQMLRQVPAGLLAAELQRRGWAVMEP